LFEQGHRVTVVDQTAGAFANLPPEFRGRLIEGEVLSQEVLDRAGIVDADGVAAVTNSDAVNAVVGHIAREVFGVPNLAVRNFDPRRRDLLEAFALPTVGTVIWGATRFEEMLTCRDARAVLTVGNGEVEVYDVTAGALAAGRSIDELLAGEAVLAVALTRGGEAVLPQAQTVVEAGDRLLLSGALAGIRVVAERLRAGEED
jgi:trk system potassium uptake protein TrkA